MMRRIIIADLALGVLSLTLASLAPDLRAKDEREQLAMLQTIVDASSAGGPSCPALSLATAPTSGWSMARKLNSSYAGNLFDLVNSGGTVFHVGAAANGCTDISATTGTGQCSGTCHVKAIYDQYGAVNFTFASYATAPLYTASCINSQPCMDNAGPLGTATSPAANDLIYTGNFVYAAVIKDNSGSPEGGYFGNVLTSGAFPGVYFGPSTQIPQFKLSFYFNGTWGNCNSGALTVVDGNTHLVAIQNAASVGTCRLDGTTASQSGTITVSSTGAVATMFGGIGGGTYTGKFSEGLAWNGASDYAGYRTSTQSFYTTP